MAEASKTKRTKKRRLVFACVAFVAMATGKAQADLGKPIFFEGMVLKDECAPMEGVGLDYPAFACAGQKALIARRFGRAVEAFEEALSLDVHEFPNIDLYPKLALAQLLDDDRVAAEQSLAAAHLAYSAELGLIECPQMEGQVFRYEGSWVPRVERLGRETVDRLIWPFCEGGGDDETDLDWLLDYLPSLNDYIVIKGKLDEP